MSTSYTISNINDAIADVLQDPRWDWDNTSFTIRFYGGDTIEVDANGHLFEITVRQVY